MGRQPFDTCNEHPNKEGFHLYGIGPHFRHQYRPLMPLLLCDCIGNPRLRIVEFFMGRMDKNDAIFFAYPLFDTQLK